MTNAKKEFLAKVTKTTATVLWARFETETKALIALNPDYASNKEDWDYFLAQLDYDYNSGLGGEHTYGVIMFSDGSWAEREEYDGSSHWAMRVKPTF
jgi:hypothetical protein